MVEEKFLIDSNSFMAPYRQYSAFDLIPTYWDELSKRTESGRLVLLDMVKALQAWAPGHIADLWLIAAAAVNDYTIITAEVPSGGLSPKNPNRNAKIPDVAKAFGVRSNNLYYMMRKLGIKI